MSQSLEQGKRELTAKDAITAGALGAVCIAIRFVFMLVGGVSPYEHLSRVRKVCCLSHQAQKGLFAPSFCASTAPYSRWEQLQILPVWGKVAKNPSI